MTLFQSRIIWNRKLCLGGKKLLICPVQLIVFLNIHILAVCPKYKHLPTELNALCKACKSAATWILTRPGLAELVEMCTITKKRWHREIQIILLILLLLLLRQWWVGMCHQHWDYIQWKWARNIHQLTSSQKFLFLSRKYNLRCNNEFQW